MLTFQTHLALFPGPETLDARSRSHYIMLSNGTGDRGGAKILPCAACRSTLQLTFIKTENGLWYRVLCHDARCQSLLVRELKILRKVLGEHHFIYF